MDQELQDKYDTHLHNLITRLPNAMYTFEVTKCCGYSTFVLVNKRGTLLDLYKEVSLWFECKTLHELYIVSNETNEKKTIPITEMVTIKDYIREFQRIFFVPLYPIPNNIVYKIYLDDGHCHNHECT
jgi:hypothetical protein